MGPEGPTGVWRGTSWTAASAVSRATSGSTLLEWVVPGTRVSELPDDEATAAVAGALRQLWVPVPAGCPLPDVAEECEVLFARDIVVGSDVVLRQGPSVTTRR